MSFEVEPSGSVVIDMTDAGPDDFLRCRLEDESLVFLRRRPGSEHQELALDEQLWPQSFVKCSILDARVWLHDNLSAREKDHLKKLYGNRKDAAQSLDQFVAMLLREKALISFRTQDNTLSDLNVDRTIRASYRQDSVLEHIDRLRGWSSGSLIKQITPVDRFGALLESVPRPN